MALANVCEEVLAKLCPYVSGRDIQDNLVAVVSISDLQYWSDLKAALRSEVAVKLDREVEVHQTLVSGGIEDIPAVYEDRIHRPAVRDPYPHGDNVFPRTSPPRNEVPVTGV